MRGSGNHDRKFLSGGLGGGGRRSVSEAPAPDGCSAAHGVIVRSDVAACARSCLCPTINRAFCPHPPSLRLSFTNLTVLTQHGCVHLVDDIGEHHRATSVILDAATNEVIELNDPHSPTEKAFEAFEVVEHTIKAEILKWRHHWDKHEPRMWSRAEGISDEDLVAFSIRSDLVEIRSAPTSYGTIILGKLRLPAVNDSEGEGYIHVRHVLSLLGAFAEH